MDLYPHMPILRPHAARFHQLHISSMTFTSAHLYGNVHMRVGVARRWQICLILDFWRSKFIKMGDSLLWTPMNRCAVCDASSIILGADIHNRTNTQTYKQTVIDISIPCLLACMDNILKCIIHYGIDNNSSGWSQYGKLDGLQCIWGHTAI